MGYVLFGRRTSGRMMVFFCRDGSAQSGRHLILQIIGATHHHIICCVRRQPLRLLLCQSAPRRMAPFPALLWSCGRTWRAYFCAVLYAHSIPSSKVSLSLSTCLQVAVILFVLTVPLSLIPPLVGISSASLPEYMTSASTQFAAPVRMGIYDRQPPLGMWSDDAFKVDSSQATSGSTIMEADTKFDTRIDEVPQVALEPARSIDQEASKPPEKVLRRLAQNREAARKSRLRKKAYIQQLETSRLKLAQLEQELQRVRQQGVYVSGNLGDPNLGLTDSIDPGVAAFEIEYNNWVDDQNRHTGELRTALQGQTSELELRMLVETGLRNYDHLFRIKTIASNSDVFYIMSGMWKTPAERFFLWIGGFRPSEVLKVLSPQLEPLTDQQVAAVCRLQNTSMQVEDALSQGMEKLQQTLAEALVATDPFGSSDVLQIGNAVEKLKGLANFVRQADHLRQTTLEQMHKILTTRQAARGLLALGDYFQRLRALGSLWVARPREPAIS